MRNLNYYRDIIRLGLPILVGQLGMIVTGFADNIMVGRYSTEALASASFVNGVFNVVIFCCLGFTYGLTPLVGALYGRGEHRRIGTLLRNGLFLNVLYSAVVTVALAGMYFGLHLMGQPGELLPLIRPYYLTALAGVLPLCVFNVFAQWLYGTNDTRTPMWIILGGNVLNIIGNYLLIFGHCGAPEMGLLGAGISTLAARTLTAAAIAAVFCFSSKAVEVRAGFIQSRIDRRSLGRIWRTSLPVSMQMTFESGSFSVAAIMSGWLGAIPLAAYQIVVITGTLGFCVYYSVGAAISVVVSNVCGCGDAVQMRRAAWHGYHIMLVLMTVSSLIFTFAGRDILGVFTDDAAVLAAASALIFPLVLYQLGDATQIAFANALRGTSHVMPMLWIAFVSYIVVGIPATWLLAFPVGLGLYGIILSFSASLFMAGALFLIYFLRATKNHELHS
ncbi:MAG: MATE family efflux transporter [Muribaculaceae bacterium]|nr:MATE family efflux transporter [Muribaculaceae bacterium]